jgi:hypothetical protein
MGFGRFLHRDAVPLLGFGLKAGHGFRASVFDRANLCIRPLLNGPKVISRGLVEE